MNPFKKIVLISLLSVSGKHVLSQDNSQIVPVSPEAAALAKMVNYPINHNTGIPDIRIPFYEINVGGLKLPIELVYHAGGFRINEQATRAGLGWSLSSDLQITRTVNGLDDFKGMNRGYIGNQLTRSFYRNGGSCPSCPYPFWSSSTLFPFFNAYELAMGLKDGMPDKFNYKLLNKSGSFYFMKNDAGTGYAIVPVPHDNIRIQFDNGRFIITDSDGTVYHFGAPGTGLDTDHLKDYGIETSSSSSGGTCTDCVRTAWKCKKIINATGTDEIVFSYEKKAEATYRSYRDKIEYYSNDEPCNNYSDIYHTSDQYPLNMLTDYNGFASNNVQFHHVSSPKYWVRPAGSDYSYLHVPYVDSGAFVDKQYSHYEPGSGGSSNTVYGLSVSSITFRGGRVVFNGADQLNYVRVEDAKGIELKSLHFFHSYKQGGYPAQSKIYNGYNFPGTRYLDSLHLRNGSNTYERYALLYNDKFCYGNHLKGHDAWGYPNVQTTEIYYANLVNSPLSIPSKELVHPRYFELLGSCGVFTPNLPLTIGGGEWNETVDETALKRGVLKRIIYPTGGFADFDFEANRYDEDFFDGTRSPKLPQLGGGLRIRSISYYDAENTHPTNYRPVSQQYYRYGDFEQGTGVLINRPRLAPGPGAGYYDAVSYQQDVVYLADFATWPPCLDRSCLTFLAAETKTTYESASALDYTYANGAPVYYTKVSEYQIDLGKQSGKNVYEYYPPGEFHDSWDAPLRTESRAAGTNIPYLKTDGLMGALKSVTRYRAVSDFSFQPVHRKAYAYMRYLRPQQIQVAYSFPKVLYTFDGSFNGNLYDDSNGGGYSHPIPDFVTEEYGIPVGCLLMTDEVETHYEQSRVHEVVKFYAYDNLPYIQPSKIITYDSKGQATTKTIRYPYNFTGTSVYDQMVTACRLNVPIEEVETRSGVEISRRRTDYATHSAGLGFIAPSTIRSSQKGQALRTELTFDLYDQYANIQQTVGPDGVRTSYIWGYNGLYPVAKLEGVNYLSVPSLYQSNVQINDPTSDAALRTLLNGLYSTFAGDHAINTYTYKRLVGMSSVTNPGGMNTFYEYDPIGRLTLQKNHNAQIVNQYEYRLKGPASWQLALNHHTNVPVLRTHYRNCPGGIFQPYNYVVPGGKYITTGMDLAMTAAENEAEAGTPVPYLPACPTTSSTAHIKIRSLYMENYTLSATVEVDFIRNGSVVATWRVKHTNWNEPPDFDSIHLPEGEYQLSIRLSGNLRFTPDDLLWYYFTDDSTSQSITFQPGQTVMLNKGKSYTISVMNL